MTPFEGSHVDASLPAEAGKCPECAGRNGQHNTDLCGRSSVPVPQPQDEALALWDESLALAFHDAIDGDFLIDAGGEGVPRAVGIGGLRVSEVVRWATQAVLASDWLASTLAEREAAAVSAAVKAERGRIAAAIDKAKGEAYYQGADDYDQSVIDEYARLLTEALARQEPTAAEGAGA